MKTFGQFMSEAWQPKKIGKTAAQVLATTKKIAEDLVSEFKAHEVPDSSTPAAPNSSVFRASVSGRISAGSVIIPTNWGGQHHYQVFVKIGSGVDTTVKNKIKQQFHEKVNKALGADVTSGTFETSDGKRFNLGVESGSNWGGVGVSFQ